MTQAEALAGVLALLLAGQAQAQAPGGTVRISGTVSSLSGDTLLVRTPADGTVTVMLPPDARIAGVVDRKLSDIKPGAFVGSAALRGRDGKLHAQEVHIFPDALRGTGEGHRPMDEPEQTMTNATVDGVAEMTNGRTLHLRYPGGEQFIEVAPDVRIWGMVPGDRGLLVPGAAVTIRAARGAGDALTSVSIQAEKDGVKPLP